MRASLTYRQKKMGVMLLLLLTMVVVYQNNIRKTILMYNEYAMMSKQLERNQNLPDYAIALKKKLTIQTESGSSFTPHTEITQSVLLDNISKACSKFNVKLVRFGDPVLYQQKSFELELNLITLEGSFDHLTECIYWLETSNVLKGNIMSAEYKLYRRFGGKGDKLMATIYLQRINSGKYEK